ncbi:MAG: hypothetical protein OXN97_15955 [Bryobacterales bacterium]|nr:hypothetical protein [Bryobacterales bacterium]
MRTPRLAPVVLLLIALLVAGCEEELPADPSRFYSDLEVLVVADDEPIGGVRVILTLYDSTNAFAERSLAETSSSGVARFEAIPPGFYTLEYEHDEIVCDPFRFWVRPSNSWVPSTMQREATCAYLRYGWLLWPGYLEFDPDTVRMNVGDTLRLIRQTEGEALPEPGPGTVLAPYISVWPRAVRCTDVPREILMPHAPPKCGTVVLRDSSRPDSPPIRVTESMRDRVARILPCDLRPEPTTGGFSECATWGSIRTEAGPGMEVIHASAVLAEACGRSWVSKTRRTGRTISWPEPFDGYARVEVEIVGC